jgi:hypothetical protein
MRPEMPSPSIGFLDRFPRSVSSIGFLDRFPRTIDQVLDEVLRKECAKSRPRPQHRRLYGDMTRALPDDPDTEFDGRVGVVSWRSHEVSTRSGDGSRPVICLMDGEHKLWDRKRELLPEGVVEVLDLWHVMDRLWDVAKALHRADDAASREFVSQRLLQILAGNFGLVHLKGRVLPVSVPEGHSSINLWLRNNSPDGKRSHMTAFVSDDDGATWKGGLLLDERESSYPDGAQAEDGTLFIIYDHQRYTLNRAGKRGVGSVVMATFREADIRAARAVTDQSRLRVVIPYFKKRTNYLEVN